MLPGFDIDVDYDTLCRLEEKLQYISHDLTESTERMSQAIQRSQDFLAGNQFEKAKNTTMTCIRNANRTNVNLNNARKYLGDLKSLLEEYGRCTYDGENR